MKKIIVTAHNEEKQGVTFIHDKASFKVLFIPVMA